MAITEPTPRRPHATVPVHLDALATALPAHRLDQADVLTAARQIFGARTDLFARLEPVFTNAEIDTRFACRPIDWFFRPIGVAEKTQVYQEQATALARDAAVKALDAAGTAAGEIDAIVFVSSTGIATPSIEARLLDLLPFRRDVMRLPVFGLGCAGGVLGLSRAAELCRARPGGKCLLIVLELCTLAFRHDRLTKSNIVATALFGDGAAAAVLSSAEVADPLGHLGAAGEHCWPETLNVMGWNLDQHGLDVIFHHRIPELITAHYPAVLGDFLQRHDMTRDGIARPCCHPGGQKVIAALESVFGWPDRGLDAERRVLARHGNMSAPTVLFVLADLIAAGTRGRLLLSALGPGFTAAFQTLDLGAAP